MSKHQRRNNDMVTCFKKVQYHSLVDATAQAVRDRKKHGTDSRPYSCPVCGLWHLTTRPAQPKRTSAAHPDSKAERP